MGDIDAPVIRVVSRLADYDAAQWNACAHPADTPYNPFLSHAFLMALEESGSASADTGWLPQHLVVETPAGDSLGAMPLYLKSHSQGEYIFDYGWADAFHRAGGRYYPKLLSAVPFTPATGPRLLIRDPARADAITRALVAGALTAWLLEDALGWTFRPAWLASSTLYLVGPALVVRVRDRRAAAAHRFRRRRHAQQCL